MRPERIQNQLSVANADREYSQRSCGVSDSGRRAEDSQSPRLSPRRSRNSLHELLVASANPRVAELVDAPDSNPGTERCARSIRATGTVLLAAIVVLIALLLVSPRAEAHEPGRAECRTYAQMHYLVTGSKRAANRAGRACRIAAAKHVLTHPLPDAQIPWTLRRIRHCESGGNYRAQNRHSTASGAYQYLDTTWGGHMGYAKARLAPPRVQDRRAIRDFRRGGTAPWAASAGCWR